MSCIIKFFCLNIKLTDNHLLHELSLGGSSDYVGMFHIPLSSAVYTLIFIKVGNKKNKQKHYFLYIIIVEYEACVEDIIIINTFIVVF